MVFLLMFRKLYYLLPPRFRFLFRRLIYLPLDLITRKKNELIPPRGLIYTGRGNFIQQGQDWRELFIEHAGLLPEDSVLDIGSGIGRIAIGLSDFLKGNYEGFDVVKLGVDWCTKNISNKYPQLRFRFIDLHNDLYKSDGAAASTFVFPYPDDSFDFGCAISVFTHMIPEEVENYLKELQRVLKVNGHAVITFFILDVESISLMNKHSGGIQFKYYPDHRHALMDQGVKSANVAYQKTYLDKLFADRHLEVIHEFKGRWSGKPFLKEDPVLAFQDILILKKID